MTMPEHLAKLRKWLVYDNGHNLKVMRAGTSPLGNNWTIVVEYAELTAANAKLEKLKDALKLCRAGQFQGEAIHTAVRLFGATIGFGALMHAASYEWRESLKAKGYPVGGEFAVGNCVTTIEKALAEVEEKP